MNNRILFLMLFLTASFTSQSQDELWKKDLKDELYEVGWIQQANDGTIIASGAKGLVGLNNVDGSIKWKIPELKSIDKNSFLNIDGLPIFYVSYFPFVGKERGILVNSDSGEILYDTKDKGYSIKSYHLVPEQQAILFELTLNNIRYVLNFNLEDWKERWVSEVGKTKGLLKKILNKKFIDHGPYYTESNDILIGIKDHVYSLDGSNGAIKWTFDGGKRIKALVYSPINKSLYVGIKKSNKLKILDPISGNDITPGKLKLRGTLIDVRPDDANNLILVETEGFNIIEPATNTFQWKKSFKIDHLDEVIPNDNGFIAIGKNDKDGSIALVDNEGKKIWSSKTKGYTYYVNPTPQGVLYISTERANILNYNKGDDVWKRDVKFKSIPAVTYDHKEDKVVLFENKKAYKFDMSSGEIDLFAEDIDLEKVNKKTPLRAEYITDRGYFLYTDQHLSLLKPDGSIGYSKYFDPPSDVSGFGKLANIGAAVAGVDLDIAGSIKNIDALTALSNGAYRKSRDQNDVSKKEAVMTGLYVGEVKSSNAVFEIVKNRYSNSQHTKDHQFLLSKKIKGSDTSKNVIYMVGKETGEIVKHMDLVDKNPNYLIDEVDDVVFLNENNHFISAYKF